MRLTMKERKRIAEATAGRYRRARKKEKTAILNEFVELTWFARSYAEMVELLDRRGELKCKSETRRKLGRMSAATIDRLLRPERKKYQLKGRAHTRPGTLLKHQIPLRTFSEWDEQRPGFLEIDLVGHDGGVIDSLHAFTLNATA